LARLAIQPEYRGETWEIEPRELDSSAGARITITVETAPGNSRQQRVRVQADYPRDPPSRARCSKQIELGKGGAG
jgi:hypothetical protein